MNERSTDSSNRPEVFSLSKKTTADKIIMQYDKQQE